MTTETQETQTIFSTDSTATTASQQSQSQTTSTVPQELAELVGEGKKYASVEDALKSVPHAQTHISKLEQEMAQLREEVSKRKAAEDILAEIKASSTQTTSTSVPNGVTEDTVAQLIQKQLELSEAKKTQKQNAEIVVNKFKESFGEKAEEMFTTLSKDTGLTVQQLNSLAASSPNAVLKLAGLDSSSKTTPVVKHPTNSVNTEGLKPQNGNGELSARVKQGASTKDLVSAWRNAGQKIGKTST